MLRHLDRRQFEIVLYVITKTGACLSEVPSDIKLVAAHKKRRYNKYLIPYYIAKLLYEAFSCDIIVGAEDFRPIYLSSVVACLLRKPVIGWNRTAINRWIKKERYWHTLIVRLIYPRLTHIVCVSQAIVSGLLSTASIKQRNIDVIYDTHEVDKITERAKEEIPQWYTKLLRKPTLMGLGRLSDEKGFDILIKAHVKLLKRGIDHNLVILGSGPFKDELRNLSDRLGVGSSVFMPGYVDNPYPLLKKATAFVLSSRYEGFPAVVLEALSLGTPVVATACGGPIDILTDGENGIMVLPDNVNSLANGMYKILSDGELRAKLSIPDTEWLRRFSPGNIVSQWQRLLKESVNE
jgi:glycosyltransferase involved in cell wall biosynthesis